ncbi:MAG: serine hydrolase [Verrucomicrobiales bacterium]|nr:serine hydrolase [Verrucomicrobiales bacterium]
MLRLRFLVPLFVFGSILSCSAQLTSDAIAAARAYSGKHSGVGMIVAEAGVIRYEDYYNGHKGKEPLHIYSGTKSFFGVLAVIAEEEGILKLDDLVAETLPEWRDDPRKKLITIRELLNFTSGLETGFEQIYGRTTADKLLLGVGLKATRERGATFLYGPGNLQVFCEVLRRKLVKRGTTYERYLRHKLIDPLGISISEWRADSHGNVIPSAGMYMNARDWLSFGNMVVAGGTWKGRQLVETDSLRKCFTGTSINPAFGLCFWLNGHRDDPKAREVDVELLLDREPMPEDWSHSCLSKSAPKDLVCSLGSNFQRLYLVPSMQLTVVHQGKKGDNFRDAEFLAVLFQGANLGDPSGATSAEKKKKSTLPRLFEGFRKRP